MLCCAGAPAGRTVNSVLHWVHINAWQLAGLGSASKSDWHLRRRTGHGHVRRAARLTKALLCSTTHLDACMWYGTASHVRKGAHGVQMLAGLQARAPYTRLLAQRWWQSLHLGCCGRQQASVAHGQRLATLAGPDTSTVCHNSLLACDD